MLQLTDGELDILADLHRDAVEDAVWEFEREHWTWLESLADRLVAIMHADGIENPLAVPVTLAAVLYDMFAIAGADVPAAIADVIG